MSDTGKVSLEDAPPELLKSDPGLCVLQHVDAGYEKAVDVAKQKGIKIPAL